jgi:hypothetical protein
MDTKDEANGQPKIVIKDWQPRPLVDGSDGGKSSSRVIRGPMPSEGLRTFSRDRQK